MNDYNIMLGHPNRIDQCAITGGQWEEGMSLANLKTRILSRVARSVDTDISRTTFTLDLGQPRSIRLLALVAHNFTVTAQIRVEAASDSRFRAEKKPPEAAPDGASLYLDFAGDVGWKAEEFDVVYDALFDAWGSTANGEWDINELEWESDNFWLGTYTAEEIEGFTAIASHILPQTVVARYWRVTILDQGNADGFVQLGRVFIGDGVQPKLNYAWGANLGYDDNTVVVKTLGGSEFFDVRERVRKFQFTLQYMADDEAYGTFLEIVRRAGISQEVMVIPDPTDMENGIRRNFLGRLNQLGPLEQAVWMGGGSAHNMAFEIKEIL